MFNQRLRNLAQISDGDKSDLENSISNLKPQIFWKTNPILYNKPKSGINLKLKRLYLKLTNLEYNIKSNSVINHEILLKNS